MHLMGWPVSNCQRNRRALICNELAKRKRLGLSGTFMAQWSWALDPGFDPRKVRYTGGSGNPGSPISGSSPPWAKVARARGLGFQKGGSNVTKRKRLGRSGTFMAQWFRRWTLEWVIQGSIPARSVTDQTFQFA